MPWSAGPGAGFTTGRPWLRLGDDVHEHNAAVEAADPDSVLACYRRLIRARRDRRALQDGRLALVRTAAPDVLAYRRWDPGPETLVVINFGPDDVVVDLPRPRTGGGWETVVGTRCDPPAVSGVGRTMRLRGREGSILAPRRG